MDATLYTDGGSRGNPGPAAFAYVLSADDGTVLDARGEAIGVATNNVAEYRALVAGLESARSHAVDRLEVRADSELMVKQMRGEYRVKNKDLQELFLLASRAARAVGAVTYTHVRREHNELADRLVNDGRPGAGGALTSRGAGARSCVLRSASVALQSRSGRAPVARGAPRTPAPASTQGRPARAGDEPSARRCSRVHELSGARPSTRM